MAYDIAHFNGTVIPVSGTDPYGRIKNAPAGTVVDDVSNGDMQVFLQKMMADAGVTPLNLPDNASNGFQLYDAAGACFPDGAAGVWLPLTPGLFPTGGTIDVSGGKTVYSKYKFMGKTCFVQQQFRGAIVTGTITILDIIMPRFPLNSGMMITSCSIDNGGGRAILYSTINHGLTGYLETIQSMPAGTYDIDINVVYEITP